MIINLLYFGKNDNEGRRRCPLNEVRLIWHIPTTVVCSVILYRDHFGASLIALVTFPSFLDTTKLPMTNDTVLPGA